MEIKEKISFLDRFFRFELECLVIKEYVDDLESC